MIYKAVREKYPHITVVGTVGPFYEGTDYDEGWKLADKLSVPMVDEHYYVSPGWMIHNQDYYDRYDRKKSKVYLGEYAAHLPGRPNNLETALSEALYLTAVERNGDVVAMASYAPLLAKDRHSQWNPDLIYFNNQEGQTNLGYYVQQMYGQNAGNLYLDSEVVLDNSREEVRKRIGVSVVKDTASDTYVVKLVNLLPVEVKTALHLEEVNLESYWAVKSILTGRPTDKKLLPQQADFELTDSEWTYSMPAYSFTVIRIYPVEKKR
ncbi:alpha-N-arabinofuranosidase 1 [gut metagenome]|uniref:Alpha-N-arabinofuranosidase 1 n=1 Tax=gut metagenome TaxID=749906 RepID=J9GIK7_9ZZZZ